MAQRVFERILCAGQIVFEARQMGRVVEFGTFDGFWGVRDTYQSFQQLSQVLVGLAALDDRDELFERFSVVRLFVNSTELIARSCALVAHPLF